MRAFRSASEVDPSELPRQLKTLREYVFDMVEYDCRNFAEQIHEWRDGGLYRHFNQTWEEFVSANFKQTPEWVDHVVYGLSLLDKSKPVKAADAVTAAINQAEARRQNAIAQADAQPLTKHGTNQYPVPPGEDFRIRKSSPGGETSDYLAARIARDRPDIQQQMKSGEFPSVRAAAIAAGILTPRIRVEWKANANADAIASALLKKISPDMLPDVIHSLINRSMEDASCKEDT
jgi:hypothetical protein